MLKKSIVVQWAVKGLAVALFACGYGIGQTTAGEMFLSDGAAFPGTLSVSRSGSAPSVSFRRPHSADPAYPGAVMKLNQVAIDVESKVFFCSGLDKYVMQLLDGRNEVPLLEADEQVRDIACSNEALTVYYSTVGTPQGGMPVPDGKILRRNLGDGRPTVLAAVSQSDVDGNWWGVFTLSNGVPYLATTEQNSRIFKISDGRPVLVGTARDFRISGLHAMEDGSFLMTTGSGKVYKTADFNTFEPALVTSLQLRDVSVRPVAGFARPIRP